MERKLRTRWVAGIAGVALVAGGAPAMGVSGTAAAPAAVDAIAPMAEGDVVAWQSEKHTFTVNDVIGNALGETDADNPNVLLNGSPGETLDAGKSEAPLVAKDLGTLIPINSTFGFDVKDFVGATPKTFDDVAEEGWVGEFTDEAGSGVAFSDAETAVMKAENLVGTWAAGLGGNEIKASTEHFTVMEAVLSCFQTIPYDYWASEEDFLEDLPAVSSQRLDEQCVNNKLPNPVDDEEIKAALAVLIPNEDNIIPNPDDLYLGTNYSVTKKDDGKVLYRWGQAVKRPTDIRFTTSLDLPEEWADVPAGEKGFKVTRAELVLKHAVTNNPNDQIRPEDWENEGATGDLPDYVVNDDDQWVSTKKCYEGDGDFIPEGTVLRDPNTVFPDAMSSDLVGGFTNAWYTTIDRDPFAWSYENGPSPTPTDELGELISGPRWRMLSNKFGQDIPSLEIPAITCDEPPYEKGTVRYEVGEVVETTINLLDWSKDPEDARWDDAASPLAWSAGWTTSWSSTEAGDYVPGQMILDEDADRCASGDAAADTCVTALGTKLTPGFDVAFYVKGDKKPLKVYDVFIRVEYEGGTVTPPATTDFGDAPLSYATDALYRNLGDTWLGAIVDGEEAPAEPLDGTGDDKAGLDDEDGVTLPDVFLPGEEATVLVNKGGSGSGVVSAYFDWDRDGTFDEAEMIDDYTGTVVSVPAAASAGASYARFVLTSDQAGVLVGEVEDHVITIGGYDYGDLPQNKYPQDALEPAGHLIGTLSMKAIDAESDPQGDTGDATGDDAAGIDDEDGVNLSKFVIGKSSTIRVTATEAGYFRAWIDWNRNYEFDEDEMVIDSVVKDGTRAFKVPVPDGIEPGTTFGRFRVSTEAEMTPFGLLPDGEVEDHQITISGSRN